MVNELSPNFFGGLQNKITNDLHNFYPFCTVFNISYTSLREHEHIRQHDHPIITELNSVAFRPTERLPLVSEVSAQEITRSTCTAPVRDQSRSSINRSHMRATYEWRNSVAVAGYNKSNTTSEKPGPPESPVLLSTHRNPTEAIIRLIEQLIASNTTS
jgi:hypothetical protein